MDAGLMQDRDPRSGGFLTKTGTETRKNVNFDLFSGEMGVKEWTRGS